MQHDCTKYVHAMKWSTNTTKTENFRRRHSTFFHSKFLWQKKIIPFKVENKWLLFSAALFISLCPCKVHSSAHFHIEMVLCTFIVKPQNRTPLPIVLIYYTLMLLLLLSLLLLHALEKSWQSMLFEAQTHAYTWNVKSHSYTRTRAQVQFVVEHTQRSQSYSSIDVYL